MPRGMNKRLLKLKPYYLCNFDRSLESFLFGNTVSSRVAALSSGSEDDSDEADESEATLEKAKPKKVAKRSKHSDSSSSDSSEDFEAGRATNTMHSSDVC